MKKLRKKEGITLIALIITILVLLILAGVIIGTINGNGGILSNANKSAEKYNNKVSEEEEILGTLENKLKEYTGENPSTPDQPTKEPTNVEYFSWTTTETEATINGFSDEGKAKYNAGEITELVIPSEYNGVPVTKIGQLAFAGYTNLETLFIPKTINSVEDWVSVGPFRGCINLSKIIFEDGIKKIPAYTFREARLKEGVQIVIPNTVTKIEKCAFYECYGITKIDIPSSVTTIGWLAFSGCTGLTELFIPKTITSIEEWASISGPFRGCTSLEKITFEEGTEKIPAYMFGEAGLKEGVQIIIPETVTRIGGYAFYEVTGITKLNLPNSITEIGKLAFSGCTKLNEVSIPKNIKTAETWVDGSGPFRGCENLSKISFEQGTTQICISIFYNATLKSEVQIDIPNSVVSIGKKAFGKCQGITELNIPSSITEIGEYAFSDATNLTTVNFRGTQAQWNAISIGSNNTPLTSATINYNQ